MANLTWIVMLYLPFLFSSLPHLGFLQLLFYIFLYSVIRAGTKAAEGVSEFDMAKRERVRQPTQLHTSSRFPGYFDFDFNFKAKTLKLYHIGDCVRSFGICWHDCVCVCVCVWGVFLSLQSWGGQSWRMWTCLSLKPGCVFKTFPEVWTTKVSANSACLLQGEERVSVSRR